MKLGFHPDQRMPQKLPDHWVMKPLLAGGSSGAAKVSDISTVAYSREASRLYSEISPKVAADLRIDGEDPGPRQMLKRQ